MLELWIGLIFTAIVVIAILYVISIWIYKRAPANMGFIRTGFLGTKVCLGSGAIVLPVFHEVSWISLETLKLIVGRSRDQAVLTSDRIRVDIASELYAHVGRTPDDLLTASRSLGEKTFDAEKVRNLMEAKIVSSIRSYAATKTLNELHENRDAFGQTIKENVIESFKINGLVLEEVTIVALEQSAKEYFKADNVFDAEGLKIITEITSDARRRVHDTEKRTTVAIRQKDLDTQLDLLEIERREAFARAAQDKEVSNEQALQMAQKQVYLLDQRLGVEEKEIQTDLELERKRTEREIVTTEEEKKREASEIRKALALEQERRDKEIALIEKAKEEQLAEISRATAVRGADENAREQRHLAAEDATLAMSKRSLENRLEILRLEKDETFAELAQEREISDEKAHVLSEKQRVVLERRWEVQQEEINKQLAVELEEKEREIRLIAKEQEREKADILRFLAREKEECDREIILVKKTRELEEAEAERLKTTAEKEKAEHDVAAVGPIASAERQKRIDRIAAEKAADVNHIQIVSQAEARREAAEKESDATMIRAKATSDAQKIAAEGIEKDAAARGRAEAEVTQRMLEAEAMGIEAKAGALKKYNEAATFLELARLQIEADRDVHIDQAKAMGTALSGAQIRMYGSGDGTVDTIRGMFTSGFALGEVLEGVAQSMPEGLRSRFASNGIRGIFGKPHRTGRFNEMVEQLGHLVGDTLGTRKKRDIPFSDAVALLQREAGDNETQVQAVRMLIDANENGVFDDVPFEKVWSLLQATFKATD